MPLSPAVRDNPENLRYYSERHVTRDAYAHANTRPRDCVVAAKRRILRGLFRERAVINRLRFNGACYVTHRNNTRNTGASVILMETPRTTRATTGPPREGPSVQIESLNYQPRNAVRIDL